MRCSHNVNIGQRQPRKRPQQQQQQQHQLQQQTRAGSRGVNSRISVAQRVLAVPTDYGRSPATDCGHFPLYHVRRKLIDGR
nr:membrane protein [Human betaherpesvirus 6B]